MCTFFLEFENLLKSYFRKSLDLPQSLTDWNLVGHENLFLRIIFIFDWVKILILSYKLLTAENFRIRFS